MSTPREILNRAGKAQSQRAAGRQASARPEVRMPAPAPCAPAPTASVPPMPENPQPARVAVPRPVRTNSVYHQLMMRHDRMHTRHLEG